MGKNNSEHVKILNTSLKKVEYSMYDFINVIHKNVNLWDRTHEDFHNRDQRESTWRAVTQELCPYYNLLKEAEQQELAKIMLKRWKNTRDSFFRNYRLQQINDNSTCTYIYEKELMFLLKCRFPSIEKDITNNNNEVTKGSEQTSNIKKQDRKLGFKSAYKYNSKVADKETPKKKKIRIESIDDNTSTINRKDNLIKRRQSARKTASMSNGECILEKKIINNSENSMQNSGEATLDAVSNIENETTPITVKAIPNMNDTKNENNVSYGNDNKTVFKSILNDPDQAFFDSIKPDLRLMNDKEKLDFKTEVLLLLKKYKIANKSDV